MKQLLGGAMLFAMSAGCSYETGVEGTEEVAGEENLGSTSEALTTGFWSPFFLAPEAPMWLPGSQVCRSNAAPGSGTAGYLTGNLCHYVYDGSAYHTTTFERVERTGLSWAVMAKTCDVFPSADCLDPVVVNKMVGTGGKGVCAIPAAGAWRAGFFNFGDGRCYTANATGTLYVATPFKDSVRALIKN